jgi:hypothetical protein
MTRIYLKIVTLEAYLPNPRIHSPGIPVSFNNKTDHHEIVEILLKVASNTITSL